MTKLKSQASKKLQSVQSTEGLTEKSRLVLSKVTLKSYGDRLQAVADKIARSYEVPR